VGGGVFVGGIGSVHSLVVFHMKDRKKEGKGRGTGQGGWRDLVTGRVWGCNARVIEKFQANRPRVPSLNAVRTAGKISRGGGFNKGGYLAG